MEYSGAETDSWKNQKQKILWHCPFNPPTHEIISSYYHFFHFKLCHKENDNPTPLTIYIVLIKI